MPDEIDAIEEEVPFELPEGFADTVKGWDIPVDKLPDAVEMFKGLQTEEGQIEAFLTFGQNLGFGLRDMEKLFADDTAPVAPATPVEAPAPEPEPEADLDQPLTRAELAALREEIVTEVRGEFTQREQAQQEQRAQAAFTVIGKWYNDNEIADPTEQAVIARLGEEIAQKEGRDTFDPDVAVWALNEGQKAYETFVESQAQKVLQRKALVAQGQPTSLSGGTSGAGEGEEPYDYRKDGQAALDNAKARVRARLRASGELES